ncbi:DUF4064 domain-containing protein [Carboxydocella sp. ULO1]|uniref:DUF4064 domain-containing protein n=1 Tax=Carboxydocella sp. ULO1 TaxID=1926599 RepID=UPI0009AC4833|nr:DUF4064 domain-containing protein [Carboxydocella sp. ULO1]GAW28947.1 membrane protein [Carboxydocella sp. ULO1]
MSRTAELILGLLGGILGLIASFIALFIGGVGSAFNAQGAGTVVSLGWSAALLSILAIVGSVMVKSKPKTAGIMFLIASIGGVISISAFYIIPGILIFIAGIMALVRKDKNKQEINVN